MVMAMASVLTWTKRVNAISFQPVQLENKHVCSSSGPAVPLLVGFEPYRNHSVNYKVVQNVLQRYMRNTLLHRRRQILDIGIRVPGTNEENGCLHSN